MKKHQPLFTFVLLLSTLFLSAQTNHPVSVQSNFYAPEMLTITAGDTVTWTNLGGFHNVNGSQATYPDNPEGFINGGASGDAWTYEYVFNTPGTYDYQCDPHVSFGMVGVITVEPASQEVTQLLLTGVYDGPLTGGLPKGIELYALEDIDDLSVYGVGAATNGGGTDGIEYTFPAASASAGDFIYLTLDEQGFLDFFGFPADYIDDSGNATNINGDDAIELFLNGEVVDVFGEIDVDGTGQDWEYQDGWAYRVSGTGPDGNTFFLSNWTFSGVNALDDETTNGAAAVPFPNGTYTPDGTVSLAANNDIASTDINQSVTIDVLENDFLPNDWSTLTILIEPNDGVVSVNPDGAVTYTPDTDFCGEDVLEYEVCDNMSCDTAMVTITIECPIDYPVYTIGEVTTVDENGALDSIERVAQLQGIVYGINLRDEGLQFTIIDENNDGIGAFNGLNNFGYTVQEGDEVIVQGELDQFSGLAQIILDTVWTVSNGNSLLDPVEVTAIDESTESQLVTIENVMLVDPAEWTGSGTGFNVAVTDGVNTYTLRIDDNVDLYNLPAPTGTFNVTGIGGQFDNSSPFDDGYQLIPRYQQDIDPYVPTAGPEYTAYPVATVTTVDANGIVDSLGTLAELEGIVYGVDLRGGDGLQFTLIDEAGDGIGVVSDNENFGYTVQEGDELNVKGTIDQANGLTRIVLDSLTFISSDNMLIDPTLTFELDESTESQLVLLGPLLLSDPSQWLGDGSSFNVALSGDVGVMYNIRIDNNTELSTWEGPAMNQFFMLTGIGGQFDTEAPFDEGYQIFPRYITDFDFTNGIINPEMGDKIRLFPNPAQSSVKIELDTAVETIRMTNALGQEVLWIQQPDAIHNVNLQSLESGVYFLTFIQGNSTWTKELIKR